MFGSLHGGYAHGLRWVLSHQPFMLGVTIAAVCLNVYLFVIAPKGFFPQQDTGRLNGAIIGAQDTSFPAMMKKLIQFENICAMIRPWTTFPPSSAGARKMWGAC